MSPISIVISGVLEYLNWKIKNDLEYLKITHFVNVHLHLF